MHYTYTRAQVLNQNEEAEFMKMRPGAFQIGCQAPLDTISNFSKHHVNEWMKNVLYDGQHKQSVSSTTRE